MRNEFEAVCARCDDALGPGQGVVHTRSPRPFPVLCDSCMFEVADEEREAAEQFD